MIEVRQDILESFHLAHRELRAMVYEDVMEQAFEVGRQTVERFEGKESVMDKLAEATGKVSSPLLSHKHKEAER